MNIARWLAPVVGSFLLLACSPSPEKVCNHIADILGKDEKDKMPDDKRSKFIDECVKDGQKQKDKDADAYNKCSKCMMGVDSLKEMEDKCKDSCPKN